MKTRVKQNGIAISYARFSSAAQAGSHSIERQIEFAEGYCKANKLKLDLSISFADHGRSAFKGKHSSGEGAFRRLLDLVEAGTIKPGTTLILESIDRASRLEPFKGEALILPLLQQGIFIFARTLNMLFDSRSCNDIPARMQLLLELNRGFQESKVKQTRLAERWKYNRVKMQDGSYKMGLVPQWLEPIRDDSGKVVKYQLIADRVKVVRRIYQLSADGLGHGLICKTLNSEKVPTFGRGNIWSTSSVARILSNRSVLGECQAHSSVEQDDENEFHSKRREPTGVPIVDYYPAIISPELFNKAQTAGKSRLISKPGANAMKVSNLFSGILRDARDHNEPWHVMNKGPEDPVRRLVTKSAAYNSSDGATASIRYDLVEAGFRVVFSYLDLDTAFGDKKPTGNLDDLRNSIDALTIEVAKIKQRCVDNTSSDALLDLMLQKETKLKAKQVELDSLTTSNNQSSKQAALTIRELISKLHLLKGDALDELRRKLRAEIKRCVKCIYLLPMTISKRRGCFVSVELVSGEWFHYRAFDFNVVLPEDLDGLHAYDFANWPEHLQKINHEQLQALESRILAMDEKGASLAEMAEALNSSITVVSRTLKRFGRTRSMRKTADSDQQMTYVTSGKGGWVRRVNNKPIYISNFQLMKLYPRLAKEQSREGTVKAANKWWKEVGQYKIQEETTNV